MKTIAITLTAVALSLFGAMNADARPHDRDRHDDRPSYRGDRHRHHPGYRPYHRPANHVYISSYHRGVPIYTERFFIRFDRFGYPVWGYRVVPRHHHYPYRGGNRVVIQGSFGR